MLEMYSLGGTNSFCGQKLLNIAPLHRPNQWACFRLVIFFIYSLFLLGAGGVCVLLLNGFFFLGGGGGGHVWTTLRIRLRLGVYSNLNVFGACLIHIS